MIPLSNTDVWDLCGKVLIAYQQGKPAAAGEYIAQIARGGKDALFQACLVWAGVFVGGSGVLEPYDVREDIDGTTLWCYRILTAYPNGHIDAIEQGFGELAEDELIPAAAKLASMAADVMQVDH